MTVYNTGYHGTGPDALSPHSGNGFSTPDRDNDASAQYVCGKAYLSGFWYVGCWGCGLTACYGNVDSFLWSDSAGSITLPQLYVLGATMWLKCP